MGAVGVGALVLARQWCRRHAYDFHGKSVVITGGSRGLGLVIARQLADEGARLTLTARNAAELDRAAADIRTRRATAAVLTVTGDTRRREDAERTISQAIYRYGAVDVLINNAGIIQVGPLDHMTIADFEDAMDTHFRGPLYMILAALPYMRRQGEGRIVNISSIGGKIAVPHLLPYCASKAALAGLSDGFRAELAAENIVVTTVCPGLMRTGSAPNALFKGRRNEEYTWFAIMSALPLFNIDARRAAAQIIDACRYGDAELIITTQAKLAVLARTLAPELFAAALALMNRLLPEPGAAGDDRARPGHESESRWAGRNKILTWPLYHAATANNEI